LITKTKALSNTFALISIGFFFFFLLLSKLGHLLVIIIHHDHPLAPSLGM
jgi:hypothetical protein